MSVLLTVNYRVSGDVAAFRAGAAEAAARIAAAPGIRWKIWGLGEDGAGMSAYLLDTQAAAEAFAAGPFIGRLKSNPAVDGVTLAWASVDVALSQITHAAFAA